MIGDQDENMLSYLMDLQVSWGARVAMGENDLLLETGKASVLERGSHLIHFFLAGRGIQTSP